MEAMPKLIMLSDLDQGDSLWYLSGQAHVCVGACREASSALNSPR